MAITQINTYMPAKNLANITVNEDYDRLGDDRAFVTVNPGTVPATITVLSGSIIECNGNTYYLDADESFQMANAAHEYITFTDNPAPAFSSQAGAGTFDAIKQGYYTGNARVLRFFIDQGGTTGILLLDNKIWDLTPMTLRFDRVRAYMSAPITCNGADFHGVIPFDLEQYDNLSHFNTGTYRYTCTEAGYFFIKLHFSLFYDFTDKWNYNWWLYYIKIRRNGIDISEIRTHILHLGDVYLSYTAYALIHLDKNDYIDGYADIVTGSPFWANVTYVLAGLDKTTLCIERLE
jgi:hypothetical protein